MARIALTGATGEVGGRVARRLDQSGVPLRLVVRDPARAPEIAAADVAEASYADGDAMRRALAGFDTLLLVSASEAADRVALHATVVDAAADAGIERIVYTSFLGAAADCTFTFGRDHLHTEEHIRRSGLAFTFLRDSLYQDVLPWFVGEDGTISAPAGEGRVSAVARDDVADVATTALLAGGAHDGRTYDLTGPAALSMDEIAAALAAVVGRPITYRAETVDEAYASRSAHGAPQWEVDGWVSSYTAIAAGELAPVTDDVEAVTGHAATPFAETLARHPTLTSHLAP